VLLDKLGMREHTASFFKVDPSQPLSPNGVSWLLAYVTAEALEVVRLPLVVVLCAPTRRFVDKLKGGPSA
jgi:hypothetical protein